MRRVIAAAEEEAGKYGALIHVENGGKHQRLVVTKDEQTRKFTLSSSPRSDRQNQEDWVRQGVRRLVRSIDAVR